jgi:cell wall-associated NlpC family hydrolase
MAPRRPRRSPRPGLPHPTQSHSRLLRRGRVPVGVVGLLAMVGLVLPILGAAPAAATSQAQVQAQIDSLATRIAILDEQYNTATIHLQQLQIQIHDSQAASAQAESNRAALRKVASQQAAAIYKEGAPDIMITLLTSKSLNDFNQKMQLLSQANAWEAGVVTRLQIADQRAKVATDTLNRQLAQAQAISTTLAHQRATLVSQLASQQTLLAQINAATRAAEAAAAAARAQAVRAALAQAAAAAAAAAAARTAAASVPQALNHVTAALPPLPNSSQAAKAVQVAMAQIGKPYVWAGAGPNVFDCSGLTMYAWGAAGVLMPHSAAAQYAMFPHVDRSALQPGDLVFFGSPIHHVGMYVGGGQMVDAPETGQDVQVQPLFGGYVGASRP